MTIINSVGEFGALFGNGLSQRFGEFSCGQGKGNRIAQAHLTGVIACFKPQGNGATGPGMGGQILKY